MPLTGTQFQQLQQALLSAFPSYNSLALMVHVRLNKRLEVIATGNLSEVVYSLITWAEAQGRIEELVRQALEECPGNPDLRTFAMVSLRMTDLPIASGHTGQEVLSSSADVQFAKRMCACFACMLVTLLFSVAALLFVLRPDTPKPAQLCGFGFLTLAGFTAFRFCPRLCTRC